MSTVESRLRDLQKRVSQGGRTAGSHAQAVEELSTAMAEFVDTHPSGDEKALQDLQDEVSGWIEAYKENS